MIHDATIVIRRREISGVRSSLDVLVMMKMDSIGICARVARLEMGGISVAN